MATVDPGTNIAASTYPLCSFTGLSDTHPRPGVLTWDGLVNAFRTPVVCEPEIRDGKRRPRSRKLFSPVTYRPGTTRAAKNVESVHLATFDVDSGLSIDAARERLRGLTYLIYSTFNHTPAAPRFRIMLPLAEPVPAKDWRTVWEAASSRLVPEADRSAKDASRFFYLPAIAPGADYVFHEERGALLDWRPLLAAAPVSEAPRPVSKAPRRTSTAPPTSTGRDLSDFLPRERILALLEGAGAERLFGDNERWFRLFAALAFACHGQPYSQEIRDRFFDWCGAHPDYAGEEGARKLAADMARWDALGAKPEERVSAGTVVKILRAIAHDPEPGAWEGVALTDVGNAERFAADHSDGIRYVEETKDWRKWDARRWRPDLGLEAHALAMETLRRMAAEAAQLPKGEREEALAHVLHSHDARRIDAMVKLGRVKVRASATHFDADPLLFNVANGTLDLRTYTLRPHNPSDLLSKVAPVEYVPGAGCPVWDAFLARVLPDPDVRSYFQRLMGYGLQGGQEAKLFALVWGPPDGGKSTALDTIAETVGCPGRDGEEASGAVTRHYADTATVEAFGVHTGGNRPELAKLLGARFVFVNEIPEGAALEGRTVKSWTGGDLVSATPKYGHPVTFRPDGLLVFMGNVLPEIDFEDDAQWERVALVTFGESIPEAERDPTLRARFDRRAVLAWLVEGHRLYRERGLRPAPEACRLAKESRRAEADPLAGFFEAATEPDAEAFTSRAALFFTYQRWAGAEHLPARERLTRAAFARAVNGRSGASRGLKETKRAGVRGWIGARIKMAFGDGFQG